MEQKKEIDIVSLWQKYDQTKSNEIRDKIIEHYLPLVKYVTNRVSISLPAHVDKEDLHSSGFFGLLDAIQRFDLKRNIKFETYAVTRIRGSILDYIRNQDWIPTSLRQKAKHYESVVGALEHKLGRSASPEEIADELGLNIEKLNQLMLQLNTITLVSLEECIAADNLSSTENAAFTNIEETELKVFLADVIDNLPEKEKLVLTLYYYEELTLKEISVIMSLTEARISQLHTKAIMRLRTSLISLKANMM